MKKSLNESLKSWGIRDIVLAGILCAASLAVQAMCFHGRSPSIIVELQSSGSGVTAAAILKVWKHVGVPRGNVAGAVWADFFFIPGYMFLLFAGIRASAIHYSDGARKWAEAFDWLVWIAGISDFLENIGLLLFLYANIDLMQSVFVVSSLKAFLLSASLLYILTGFIHARWTRGFWDAVRVCGFSLFAALVGPGLMAFGHQGTAIFASIGEHLNPRDPSAPRDTYYYWMAVLGTLFFSLMCWGAARYAVSYKEAETRGEMYSDSPPEPKNAQEKGWRFGQDWVPRLCGIAPSLLIILIIVTADTVDIPKEDKCSVKGILGVSAVIGLWMWFHYVHRKQNRALWKKIDTIVYRTVSTSGILLVAIFCLSPSTLLLATTIGPLAAWFFSFSLMVPFFTFLIWIGRRHKKPYLALVLAYGFLINAANLNDDHGLRHQYRTTVVTEPSRRLNNAFDNWLASQNTQPWKAKGEPYPVIFVAAAGGGIVAGSVLTSTMAEIHSSMREAEDHVFAISGVSGGSLGAVAYSIARANGRDAIVQPAMTSDMLSPTLASLLGPELVQRFLPFTIPNRIFGDKDFLNDFATDRGRALDLAFEKAIDRNLPKDTFFAPKMMLSNYPPPKRGGPPALFLNTTCVETGQRMVISTLLPDVDTPQTSPPADRSADPDYLPLPFETLHDVDPHVDIPLETAACLSARFPVVSPPAFLPQWRDHAVRGAERCIYSSDDPCSYGRVKPDDPLRYITVKRRYVDGGYCENSGVQTAMDVIDALQRENSVRRNLKQRMVDWRPILIAVHMEDSDTTRQTARTDWLPDEDRAPRPVASVGFDEVTGPIFAFFNGWGGPVRPELVRARRRLRGPDGESDFVEMSFPRPAILSWYLSQSQYDTMNKRARTLLKAEPGNRLKTILSP